MATATRGQDLLSSEFLTQLERLALVSRRAFRGRTRGERKSPRKGMSVEFSDYRQYGVGDDLRYVDWNIYGRLDRLYLKLFVDEEDLCLHLLLDGSGSMSFGAGVVAARNAGAAEIVDPFPYAVASIAATYVKYPNAKGILPAMGYGDAQIRDLEATIEATPCDVVISATPIDITRVLKVNKPMVRATYSLAEVKVGQLEEAVRKALKA